LHEQVAAVEAERGFCERTLLPSPRSPPLEDLDQRPPERGFSREERERERERERASSKKAPEFQEGARSAE
jgi:hypothetical protein